MSKEKRAYTGKEINNIILALKQAYGQKPVSVKGQYNERTEYYKFILTNKVNGIFEIDVPDNWDEDYFRDHFLFDGRIGITRTAMGALALKADPSGCNVFQRAVELLFANNILGSFKRTIDEDSVVLYLFDNKIYRGISQIIDIYANRLALCDEAIDVNLVNTKVANVFEVSDPKEAEEMKMMYDKIQSGEPAVFLKKNDGIGLNDKMTTFNANVKQTYIAADIQSLKRDIYNEFLTLFCINNAAQEKKERLLVDEVNSNNDELTINVNYMYHNIKKGVEKAHKMFPELKGKFDIRMPYYDKLLEAEKELMKEGGNDDSDRPNVDMDAKESDKDRT